MASTEFIITLQKYVQELKAVPPSNHSGHKFYVHGDLKGYSHVFLRVDKVRLSPETPYQGFEVLDRTDKNMTILCKGKKVQVSVDRSKPAYLFFGQ